MDEDEALLMYVKRQLLPSSVGAGRTLPLSCGLSENADQESDDGSSSSMEYEPKVRAVVDWISCKTVLIRLLVDVATKVLLSSFFANTVWLSNCLSVCLSVRLSVCLCLSLYLSVSLSVTLSLSLSLSLYLSVCLSV